MKISEYAYKIKGYQYDDAKIYAEGIREGLKIAQMIIEQQYYEENGVGDLHDTLKEGGDMYIHGLEKLLPQGE